MHERFERDRDVTHTRNLTAGGLADLLAAAGLMLIRLEEETFSLDFDEWFDRGTPAAPKARCARGCSRVRRSGGFGRPHRRMVPYGSIAFARGARHQARLKRSYLRPHPGKFETEETIGGFGLIDGRRGLIAVVLRHELGNSAKTAFQQAKLPGQRRAHDEPAFFPHRRGIGVRRGDLPTEFLGRVDVEQGSFGFIAVSDAQRDGFAGVLFVGGIALAHARIAR